MVVATYNRPDVLGFAVKSALAQGSIVDRVLVIGDCCDDRTREVCEGLQSDRVFYINLPTRFGEQSGPNSVGMHLARSRLVALLNHDDILLPDHFEHALDVMESTGAQLFLGRAANAANTVEERPGLIRPSFSRLHPVQRMDWRAFRDWFHVEPASAWVFDRALLEVVGPWRPARELRRSPIADWFLRAWRKDVIIAYGSELSVLKISPHAVRSDTTPLYNRLSPEHEGLSQWISEVGTAVVKHRIEDEVARAYVGGKRAGRASRISSALQEHGFIWTAAMAARSIVYFVLGTRTFAHLFRYTGLDAINAFYLIFRVGKGQVFNTAVQKRTGTSLPQPPDLPSVIEAARVQLEGLGG